MPATAVSSLIDLAARDMMRIEGGSFTPEGGPIMQVDDFLLSRYHVTQELWEGVMGNNPSSFSGARRPVEKVSWYDAVEFCNALSECNNLAPCYYHDKAFQQVFGRRGGRYTLSNKGEVFWNPAATGYRLPTEMEWEYAARGGRQSQGFEYAGGEKLEESGWYDDNSYEETQPVGLKLPNELGLYDMNGNVWEWCWDWYGNYPKQQQQLNYKGADVGSHRVVRGGSWNFESQYCRVSNRFSGYPGFRYYFVGFRVAASFPQ